jgi:hypothetical protein
MLVSGVAGREKQGLEVFITIQLSIYLFLNEKQISPESGFLLLQFLRVLYSFHLWVHVGTRAEDGVGEVVHVGHRELVAVEHEITHFEFALAHLCE